MLFFRYFAVLACALMFAVLPSTAQARPRDEVMSNAYRCAGIGESRMWLDCFYGAAQPARAALGLKPAPADQVALSARPPANAAVVRDMAVRDAVMAGVFHCGDRDEDRAWLDCYYAAAQPMRVSLGLAAGTKPAPPVAPVIASAAQSIDNFGKPPAPQPVTSVAKQIWSRMTSYSFDKFGYFTVILANDQAWRQVDGDTDFARWKGPAGRYLVHVTHGFLGSFNLQVKDQPGKFKVLRVQ